MKNRKIATIIKERSTWKSGRILVLTGARQTGKTTLARHLFPEYEYISIEDPLLRGQYTRLTAAQWKQLYPHAVLDEVQKAPTLIESIKSVYDLWEEPRYILLGSSQLLLMEKVKESMAGRCIVIDFFPLTLPELRSTSWEDTVEDSLFQKELKGQFLEEYLPSFDMDKQMPQKQQAWEDYQQFGAYPAVSDSDMSAEEKFIWLQNYVRTYLERDIRDLASFRDLQPFISLQRYMAENTGTLLNAAAVAKRLGITSKTVQRYIHYFELSYQCVLLPGWASNPNKRMSKMGKIHYLDNGVIRAILQKRGGMSGNEFESLVVAEMYKQIATGDSMVQLSHLRTYDGKEIDLLVETPDYYLAFEIKMTDKANKADAKHLLDLETILNKPLKRAYLLSNDRETRWYNDKTVGLNVTMFLG